MYEEQVINVWVLMVSRPFVLRLVLNDCIHTLGKKKSFILPLQSEKKKENVAYLQPIFIQQSTWPAINRPENEQASCFHLALYI